MKEILMKRKLKKLPQELEEFQVLLEDIYIIGIKILQQNQLYKKLYN